MKKKIVLLVILFITSIVVYSQTSKSRGAIAYPYFQQFEQPDGTSISLKMKGDGVLHWFVTKDGQKVLRDKNSWFVYATQDAKSYMIPSSARVGKSDVRDNGLSTVVTKNLFFSKEQIRERENSYFGKKRVNSYVLRSPQLASKTSNFPTIGKFKGLMILAEFPDKPHVVSASKFHDIMNQENYNETGSFRDYYLENSYGKLDVTTDIVQSETNDYIWVKLPHNMEYYGGNRDKSGSDKNPQQMIIDAVLAADKYVDFSQYDNDKNNMVDNVMVIHSGYGEEGGAEANTVWSHRYMLGDKAVEVDGVKVSDYITFPELSENRGENSTNIGVLVHEFGHALGLPDYYDTDAGASGGIGLGLGDWDVMDHGSWNASGVTPAHHNSYSKHLLGWLDIPVLNDEANPVSGKVELKNQAENDSEDKDRVCAYMIKTSIPNDFFVLENRQQRLFDSKLPSHGMIVYHVDRTKQYIWDHNNVNDDPGHECMRLLFAGGVFKKSAQTYSVPFPGNNRVTRLTDYTTPNLRAWGDYLTGSFLTNIKESQGIISFDYMPHSKVDLTLNTQYRDGAKLVPLSGTKLIFQSISSPEASPVTITVGEDNTSVLKDFYLGIYRITVSNADREFEGKKLFFDTVYENVEITSTEKFFNLKEAMKFRLAFNSFEQDKETMKVNTSIDYSGTKVALILSNTNGKKPIEAILDLKGECVLKDFIRGNYDVTIEIESKILEIESPSKEIKEEEVFFTNFYQNFSFNLTNVILNLEKATVLNLIYTYQGKQQKDINFTGDMISLSSIEDAFADLELREDGSCLLGNVKNGFYDIQTSISDKTLNVNGKFVNISFKDSYSKVLVKAPTATLELKLKDIESNTNLRLYPNPTKGEVQIETSLKTGAIIKIFNMTGLLVFESILEKNDLDLDALHSIDLSSLNAGIYNILITDGNTKVSRRIIKQ